MDGHRIPALLPLCCNVRLGVPALRGGPARAPELAIWGTWQGQGTWSFQARVSKTTKQENKKSKRHESNCPDRPSRKRTDSCQPLEIFGLLPTSKLERILIYKNDSLGPPWAESCPQANCLGATPTGSARGALDDALLQPESFWGSELLFGVPGKHTQRLTPAKHHIYVRRWTTSQKDAGLLQYQTFIVSVSEV